MAGKKSVDEWSELFKQFDKDGSNALSVHELRDMMQANGSKMPDSEIANMFLSMDGITGDKKVTLEEFTANMQNFQEQIEKVTDLFKATDKDGSGYLTKDELKPLILSIYPKLSSEDMEKIFEMADQSGEGKISLEEFISTCT